jgi:hypothetical protein
MSKLGEAARRYASKGLAVFPLRPRSKEPYGDDKFFRTVGGYKCATRDPPLIDFWWGRQPEANIGIATGSVSGMWVLDLDDDDDEAWLRRQEAEHGALPPTVVAITGKGRHLYFRYPLGVDVRNIQDRDDFPDVRGNGGYVLAPPSVHPSGRRYAWSVDSGDSFEDAPGWLIEAVTKPRGQNGGAPAASPEAWRSFLDTSVDGSHRGHAVARLYGLLVRRYVDAVVALGVVRMFNTLRCQPPLDDADVVRIADDIANREADRRRLP